MKLDVTYEEPSLRDIQNRSHILYIGLGILFLLLIIRLVFLQIIQGSTLYTFSEKNLLKEIRVQPPRGVLYDRHRAILAENLPNFALTLSPQYVKDTEKVAAAISPVVDIPKDTIVTMVKKAIRMNGIYRPVTIKNFLSRTEINRLELLRIDYVGIEIEELIFREYPYNDIFAHVLGYIGEISPTELPKLREKGNEVVQQGDVIGKSGIEDKYDDQVRGLTGISYVKVDAKGREALGETLKFLGHIEDLSPKPGHSLETTLDLDLQKAAAEAFKKYEHTGTLVAINRQGEILALYNSPSFDPNLFSKGISSDDWSGLVNNPLKPLRNRAIQDHYSPGSTFKPIVALAALQMKKITENTLVSAPPVFMYGNRAWHDHTKTGQGYVTVAQAIEQSANVFFFKQGLAVGIDNIALFAKALGLGKKTEIDLKNEVPGLIPTTEWKKKNRGEEWMEGETLSVAIGQGYVAATALHLANAYMSIANGGLVYKPFIVKKIMDNQNRVIQEFPPTLVTDMTDPTQPYYVAPEHFKAVQKGLWHVANGKRGTAAGINGKVPGFIIAGKTGTAQVRGFSASEIYESCESRPKKMRHNGWYVAYGPFETPEVTVAVLTEHSCSSRFSVPVVRDFFLEYQKKYHASTIAQKEDKKK